MTLTLEEIARSEEALVREIADGQKLLAAYRLILANWQKTPFAMRDAAIDEEPELELPPEPAACPVALAAAAQVQPQLNLEALSKGYGGGIRVVTWAIRQMAGNFTVHKIAATLRQANCPMRVKKISVILNRMKDERKIEELLKGRGRTPSLFCATDLVHARPLQLVARHRASRSSALLRAFS